MFLVVFMCLCLGYGEGYKILGNGYHASVGIPRAIALQSSVNRIVGGSAVGTVDTIPYQAGIIATLTTGWTSVCGGSLVASNRVLTAAHCWWDGQSQARQFTIVLGSLTIFSGGTRITTTDVTAHPLWDPNQITNDIAMVKISTVSLSNSIQVIPLPTLADTNLDFVGVTALASGYGKTTDAQNSFPTSTALHHVSVNIITNAVCQKSFEAALHGSHLCTNGVNGVGTCDGDSGGPLTAVRNNQRILVGITSFGLGNGCQQGYPSVYTRVTAFLPWINAQL